MDQSDYFTDATVDLDLENVGEVTFTRLEFRVTVSYDSIDDDPRVVGSGYVERRWDEDGGFAPGTTTEYDQEIRFETNERASRWSDGSRFSFDIEYRRVAYR